MYTYNSRRHRDGGSWRTTEALNKLSRTHVQPASQPASTTVRPQPPSQTPPHRLNRSTTRCRTTSPGIKPLSDTSSSPDQCQGKERWEEGGGRRTARNSVQTIPQQFPQTFPLVWFVFGCVGCERLDGRRRAGRLRVKEVLLYFSLGPESVCVRSW